MDTNHKIIKKIKEKIIENKKDKILVNKLELTLNNYLGRLFVFSARFPLNFIAKNIPESLEKDYILALKHFNYSKEDFIYKEIDIEDWIESIIPLVELYKENLLKQTVLFHNEFKLPINLDRSIEYNLYVLGLIANQRSSHFVEFLNEELIKMNFNIHRIAFPAYGSEVKKTQRYMKTKFFKALAGRNIYPLLSMFDKETHEYLVNKESHTEQELKAFNYSSLCKDNQFEDKLVQLTSIQKEFIKPYFLKTVNKKWSFTMDLKQNSTKKDIIEKLIDLLDWSYINAKSKKHEIFLQDHVLMNYEYRMIVVNGELTAGAGCVEEYTPVNSDNKKFDTKVMKNRGYCQEKMEGLSPRLESPEDKEKLVSRYKDFALKVIPLIHKELQIQHYTLDLAVTSEGKIVIVELNPYENIGFYALNYKEIILNLMKNRSK